MLIVHPSTFIARLLGLLARTTQTQAELAELAVELMPAPEPQGPTCCKADADLPCEPPVWEGWGDIAARFEWLLESADALGRHLRTDHHRAQEAAHHIASELVDLFTLLRPRLDPETFQTVATAWSAGVTDIDRLGELMRGLDAFKQRIEAKAADAPMPDSAWREGGLLAAAAMALLCDDEDGAAELRDPMGEVAAAVFDELAAVIKRARKASAVEGVKTPLRLGLEKHFDTILFACETPEHLRDALERAFRRLPGALPLGFCEDAKDPDIVTVWRLGVGATAPFMTIRQIVSEDSEVTWRLDPGPSWSEFPVAMALAICAMGEDLDDPTWWESCGPVVRIVASDPADEDA